MRLTLVERALLLRVSDTPGGFAVRRSRRPLGWQVGSDQRDIPFTWFPPRAGERLARDGLIDAGGRITADGKAALRQGGGNNNGENSDRRPGIVHLGAAADAGGGRA